MLVTCPGCGESLEMQDGIAEGQSLQCTSCGAKFSIVNGIATAVADAERPMAVPCVDPRGKRPTVSFYDLCGQEERRNYAWRRWTARAMDFYVGLLLTLVLYYVAAFASGLTGIGLDFWEWIAQPQNEWADYVLTTILSYFFSSILYAMFGTTPGKKICGLLVSDSNGARMPFVQYVVREARVLFYGEWLCIPLLTLFGLNRQYNRVVDTGGTSYDTTGSNPLMRDFHTRPLRGKCGYDTFLVVLMFIVGVILRSCFK